MAAAALSTVLATGCADDREIFVPETATQTGTGGAGGEAGNGAGAEGGSGGQAGQGGAETCTELETKCGGKCVDLYTNPDNCGECGYICEGVKEACYNATCQCASGTNECNDECAPASDPHDCGGCGNVCDDKESCQPLPPGACAPGVPEESCYGCGPKS